MGGQVAVKEDLPADAAAGAAEKAGRIARQPNVSGRDLQNFQGAVALTENNRWGAALFL